MEDTVISNALDEMITANDVIHEDEALYLPAFYYSEVGTAKRLLGLMAAERSRNAGNVGIFRQAAGSRIITNAHRINKGQYPDIHTSKSSDFFFIETETPEDTVNTIGDM